MSANRNSSNTLQQGLILIAIAVCAGLFYLSRKIGADFFVSAKTLGWLLLTSLFVFAVHMAFSPATSITASLFLVFAWPGCWPLLESIASGGKATNAIYDYHLTAWYVQSWFLWGVEVILVAILAYIIYFDE